MQLPCEGEFILLYEVELPMCSV